MNILAFLEARITEDEAAAKAATQGEWEWEGDNFEDQPHRCPHRTEWADHGPDLVTTRKQPPHADGSTSPAEYIITSYGYDASGLHVKTADAEHITRYNPTRVLAECAAKRAIIKTAQARHYVNHDDSWYTCPAAKLGVDTNNPDALMSDAQGKCTCGYDGTTPTLRHLATIYDNHPDYRQEWRPTH